jgi:hypothetical protein
MVQRRGQSFDEMLQRMEKTDADLTKLADKTVNPARQIVVCGQEHSSLCAGPIPAPPGAIFLSLP